MKSAVFITLLCGLLGSAVQASPMNTETSKGSTKDGAWTPGICVRQFPEELRKDFPVYVSGYDYQDRPVVFWEVGHFNYAKWAEHNETTRQLSSEYFEHIWCKIHNLTSPIEDAEEGITMVLDATGFDAKLFFSIEVTKMNLAHMRLADQWIDSVAEIILINANIVSETWINLVRPVAGKFVGSMRTAGSRKDRWLPVLREYMEIKAIPPWITGEDGRKDYKPLEVW